MSLMPIITPGILLTTLSMQASATSTSSQITVPASVQEGDLLMLLDSADSSSDPGTVIPTGFTSVVNTFFNGGMGALIRQIASYKIAGSSDASSNLTGMNGTVDRKMLYVFRGNTGIGSVSVQDVGQQGTSGNPALQSVSASSGTVPLIVFGCYGSNGTVSPRSFTPAKDGEINADTGAYLAYKIYNSSPADVSIDMDDEGGANLLQSFYIKCS